MMRVARLQLALSLALLACAQLGAAQNFTLPPLPYSVDALEPIIDTQTMTFHHDIHHNNYVVALNNVLATQRQISSTATLTDIVSMVGTRRLRVTADVETTIRNQAGGAWNHAMFWKVMAPANSSATTLPSNSSALGQAVINSFGSFSALISRVNAAAAGRFGSGWAWVVYRPRTAQLEVVDSANQDCPLMGKTPLIPILGVDVWEHAYYLKHGPRRAAYMQNWWQVANWQQIAANYETARAGTDLEPLVGAVANRRS